MDNKELGSLSSYYAKVRLEVRNLKLIVQNQQETINALEKRIHFLEQPFLPPLSTKENYDDIPF